MRMAPSPVVELNRAAAVAMADGPAIGLAMMDGLAATGELETTRTSTPPGRTCSAGSGGGPRRPPPTVARSR